MIFKYKELTTSVFPEAYLLGDGPNGAPPWLADAGDPNDYADCTNTCGRDTGANCAVCTNAENTQVPGKQQLPCNKTNCNVTCGYVTDCTPCKDHTPPPPLKDRQAADLAFLQEQVRQVQALGL